MSTNEIPRPLMRAKMQVQRVMVYDGSPQQDVTLKAVSEAPYGPNGESEDNTFAFYTPTADVKMTINNPALTGKIQYGQKFYVDFTPAE